MGKFRRFIEDAKELPQRTVDSPKIAYVIPIVGVLATAGLMGISKSCEKKDGGEDKLRPFLEADAERFAALKDIKIDIEAIEACEKHALSGLSWDDQSLKVRCNNMRLHLEKYKKVSKEIADKIKKKDAKKTPKAIQMRKK
jgi:hypothetical protein